MDGLFGLLDMRDGDGAPETFDAMRPNREMQGYRIAGLR
jgi:hypothetical protein